MLLLVLGGPFVVALEQRAVVGWGMEDGSLCLKKLAAAIHEGVSYERGRQNERTKSKRRLPTQITESREKTNFGEEIASFVSYFFPPLPWVGLSAQLIDILN